ncbi:hypothetical protein UFOVP49_219 [uncultured Caudovirales phage]|uniref:Uncharacterized protein n=1 Tax=uncultured Caudovirales phage TaxID=2100421 RepID=A0A6J5KR77_9CAUD|nr:hypothetical protein UFOVP49_219 [uncultured Caudovirales phage]
MNTQFDYVCVITSAISPDPLYSLIDPKTRYAQTLSTIDSIRKYIPNCFIILTEATVLPSQAVAELTSKVDSYISLCDRRIVQKFNSTSAKGQNETYMMLVALDRIRELGITCRRVFKIAGRYELTEGFDLSYYNNVLGKFVFKTHIPSHYYDNEFSLHTRLWSFCGTSIDKAGLLFQNLLITMMTANRDVEHAFYMLLGADDYVEFEWIGVKGYLGLLNIFVEE